MLRKLLISFFSFVFFFFSFSLNIFAQDHSMQMFMVEKLSVTKDGTPVSNANVYAFNQSRTTDTNGKAEFENVDEGNNNIRVVFNNKEFNQNVNITSDTTSVALTGEGSTVTKQTIAPAVVTNTTDTNSNLGTAIGIGAVLILILLILVIINRFGTKIKNYSLKRKNQKRIGLALGGLGSLVLLGAIITQSIFITDPSKIFSLTDNTKAATIVSSLPVPLNLKSYGDDRVATLTWDIPADTSNVIAINWNEEGDGNNTAAQNDRSTCLNTAANKTDNINCVVGYYIKWYDPNGNLVGTKQTIHNIAQIQPLTNGSKYTVTVQSVEGYIDPRSYAEPVAYEGTVDGDFAISDGNLSNPVQITVIPTSARVDAERQRLTGFFDDFNTPSGDFDETKWNTAYTACTYLNEAGQFINSQFHAHNQMRSDCDRGGTVARPRAIFDVTGRTEANPGQIEFDIDGVSQTRDAWYIDLIAEDNRKDKTPIDVTSHNNIDDQDTNDPGRMIRISQRPDKIGINFYNELDNSNFSAYDGQSSLQGTGCPDWAGNSVNFQWCDISTATHQDFSAGLPTPTTSLIPIPNVRRHWVIQYSPTKIKIFIDNALVLTANNIALFAGINRYEINSTIFTYNTGKQYNIVKPTTSILHWDNFGFNGPAPTTVVHNYLEGGADGTTPYIARGTNNVQVPESPRTTIIKVPDQIGTTVNGKARLMFTLQAFGSQYYNWTDTNYVTVNNIRYNIPDPRNNWYYIPAIQSNTTSTNVNNLIDNYTPVTVTVPIDTSSLKTGDNIVYLHLGNGDADALNVHLELEYNKSNEPVFTQPKQIFSTVSFDKFIIPTMRTGDSYWFVEQDMGLTNTTITPVPTTTSSSTNTPTLTPTNTSTVTPTPVSTTTLIPTTVNTACVPDTSINACSTSCVFNKLSGTSYGVGGNGLISYSRETGLGPTPTAIDQLNYCNRTNRTLGDADGDGLINSLDYIYYVRAVNGGAIPARINPDFNGDGVVSVSDRAIVVQSIPK